MKLYEGIFEISLDELGGLVNRIVRNIKGDYNNTEKERSISLLVRGEEYSLRTNGVKGTPNERAVKISPLGNKWYLVRTNDPNIEQILPGYKFINYVEENIKNIYISN